MLGMIDLPSLMGGVGTFRRFETGCCAQSQEDFAGARGVLDLPVAMGTIEDPNPIGVVGGDGSPTTTGIVGECSIAAAVIIGLDEFRIGPGETCHEPAAIPRDGGPLNARP